MPIVCTTPRDEIDRYFEQRVERMNRALLRRLQIIGEQVVNTARTTKRYLDWTGNLCSSVGYVIAQDGKVIYESAFPTIKDGAEGSKQGRDYAHSIAREYPLGVVLIVVAGMHYASYVEAKGKDVLMSAELLAQNLVPKALKKLGLM